MIGKFGIGFKSVFSVTKTPYIFSGSFNIKIDDFVIPEIVEKVDISDEYTTLIRLPFNNNARPSEECIEIISKKLESIGLKTMLFLRNIQEISWEIIFEGKQRNYLKDSKTFENYPKVKKVFMLSDSSKEEYIVIEKPFIFKGKDLKVEIAYKLENNKIVSEERSKLFVYFQTEKGTFLNFIINGPYITTSNRENIPLDNEQNKKIISETAELVGESLSIIKNLNYFDASFFSVLPINPDYKRDDIIYSIIFDRVKSEFLTKELLPTIDNKYSYAKDVLIADGQNLIKLLNKDDIQKLFSKSNWLNLNAISDITRKYLINEIEIMEVDFEKFARQINPDFLENKSDEWMINFYSQLNNQKSLYEKSYLNNNKPILRTKKIIRLENGEHIAPFDDNDKVQVYLPTKTDSRYKTVKRNLTENEESLKFFKILGLQEPDIFSEIKELILPKYEKKLCIQDGEYDEYIKDIRKIYEFSKEKELELQNLQLPFLDYYKTKYSEIINEIVKFNFILSCNGKKDNLLCKPSEIYLKSDELVQYFEGYDNVLFVSDRLFENFGKKELTDFLRLLGVEDKPRRKQVKGNFTSKEISGCKQRKLIKEDDVQIDYEYEGLENALKHISQNKSCILWNFLLKSIETLSAEKVQKFFEGEFKCTSNKNSKFVYPPAKFTKMLKSEKWLIGKDGNDNFRKSTDMFLSDLAECYTSENNSNVRILKEILGFKEDTLEKIMGHDEFEKYQIVKDMTLDQVKALKMKATISKTENITNYEENNEWTAEVNPDEVTPKKITEEPLKKDIPDLSNQTLREREENDEINNTNYESTNKTISNKKDIGRWGEEFVYNELKQEYPSEEYQVVWLNQNEDTGRGYDIIIKKDEKDIKYIEVKTKTSDDPEFIDITETQWTFARKLCEEGNGEMYSFYVVSNAGKKDAKIKEINNPVKYWYEGKLDAQPVRIKFN
jgi:hypothetical protein